MGCRERTGISEGLREGRDQSGACRKPLLTPELGSDIRKAGLWEDGWVCGVGVAAWAGPGRRHRSGLGVMRAEDVPGQEAELSCEGQATQCHGLEPWP